jgi:hypothetical protein
MDCLQIMNGLLCLPLKPKIVALDEFNHIIVVHLNCMGYKCAQTHNVHVHKQIQKHYKLWTIKFNRCIQYLKMNFIYIYIYLNKIV